MHTEINYLRNVCDEHFEHHYQRAIRNIADRMTRNTFTRDRRMTELSGPGCG